MDNGPVTMLSTIHQINGDENRIERIRRRPRETSTNATKVRAIFGSTSKKSLPIPVVIDDYNHFMDGVDITDQLAIINSYLILKKSNANVSYKEFRTKLVWDLIKAELEEEEQHIHTRSQVDELTNQFKFIQIDSFKKQQYVTVSFELSLVRLSPDGHLPKWRETRSSCIWGKYLAKKNQEKTSKNLSQSQLYCIKCSVALCCNKNRSCFKDYHTQKDDNN
uniref:Piggybac transposable element-derived protein 4-like n=1 Tax=Rhizophagus irregularis (strain DAOM 181602 / DAOM 197198 / MUCL 43194) TaxID=747089 RepID=U9TZ45_RHIID